MSLIDQADRLLMDNKQPAHTPGPWMHYDDSISPNKRHEIVALGKTIAHIYCSVPEQDGANAKLIAAAPDLAEALAWMVKKIDDYPIGLDESNWLRNARAALTKAGL